MRYITLFEESVKRNLYFQGVEKRNLGLISLKGKVCPHTKCDIN